MNALARLHLCDVGRMRLFVPCELDRGRVAAWAQRVEADWNRAGFPCYRTLVLFVPDADRAKRGWVRRSDLRRDEARIYLNSLPCPCGNEAHRLDRRVAAHEYAHHVYYRMNDAHKARVLACFGRYGTGDMREWVADALADYAVGGLHQHPLVSTMHEIGMLGKVMP